MVAKKRQSKRTSLQKKYKIQKRTKEHHKKLKKGKILNLSARKKKVVDHIPNAWPYKDQLLKEIALAKEKLEEQRQRKMEQRALEQTTRRDSTILKMLGNDNREKMDLDQLEGDDTGEMRVDQSDGSRELKDKVLGQGSRRQYMGELRKVVEGSDVILHVLDARDPNGTKSTAIEEMVLSSHKRKLVYVLNKADLVPRDVLSGWLAHLRCHAPAIPFKSNTQSGQKGNLGRSSGKVEKSSLTTSQAVGADELIGLLKNYARSGSTKTSIAVGIVGFPNVGKSSLINSLLRSRAVGVSSTPGHTKAMQEVVLDKTIRLFDSPGIVFADGDSAATALRNCVNVDEIDDVITPIQAILEKCPQAYLMQLYSIPRFNEKDCTAFLALVARGTGKLKKGGVPNIDQAARGVLHDWNTGKIKFYCKPPKVSKRKVNTSDDKILDSFSEEFDIEKLLLDETKILNTLEAEEDEDDVDEYLAVDNVSNHAIDFVEQEEDENDDMDTVTTSASTNANRGKNTVGIMLNEANMSIGARKAQKQMKKKEKKRTRRATEAVDEDDEGNMDYDFNEHFQ